MKAYSNILFNKYDHLPITEKMAKGIFSLPLYPKIKDTDVIKIAKILIYRFFLYSLHVTIYIVFKIFFKIFDIFNTSFSF